RCGSSVHGDRAGQHQQGGMDVHRPRCGQRPFQHVPTEATAETQAVGTDQDDGNGGAVRTEGCTFAVKGLVMRKIVGPTRWRDVTAAAILLCLAGGARADNTPSAPLITPPIDDATLAKASAKGQTFLAGARWKAEIPLHRGILIDAVGLALVCRGAALESTDPMRPLYRTLVLDRGTGRVLLETSAASTMISPAQTHLPIDWTDNGLVSFEVTVGQLKLQR